MDTDTPTATAATPPDSPRLPGDLAIWVFILAEMAAFAVFFAVYAFARARNVELFDAAQLTLDRRAGLVNTLLLVTGGWFAARSVHAARADRIAAAGRGLALAFACGAGFLAVKVAEYAEKIAAGISMSTNTFYLLYFSLTFFHFLHVILGMAILAILFCRLRQGAYSRHDVRGLETGTAYWHMVDLLWIVLFPLVYVMR